MKWKLELFEELVADFLESERIEQFIRVHGEENQVGPWLMRREGIKGLTPQQIQNKFAIPELPIYVSDV
jgi:hypothetical protein